MEPYTTIATWRIIYGRECSFVQSCQNVGTMLFWNQLQGTAKVPAIKISLASCMPTSFCVSCLLEHQAISFVLYGIELWISAITSALQESTQAR